MQHSAYKLANIISVTVNFICRK